MSIANKPTNWLAAIDEAYDMLLRKAEFDADAEQKLHQRINTKIHKPGWQAAIEATWEALEEQNAEREGIFETAARRPRQGGTPNRLAQQCERQYYEVDIPTWK